MKDHLSMAIILILASANSFAQAPSRHRPQGKIISYDGRVEMTPAQSEDWRSVNIFQDLLVQEQVRTFVASRTAILFINEAQVKLNAGSILTVPEVIQGREFISILELRQGEAWVRTKNQEGRLVVRAGETTSELEGTEINLSIQPGNVVVLTVLEGSVLFSNTQGQIRVDRSEQATASPGAPPTKQRILNPEDAVQWSLYYPTSFPLHDLPSEAKTGPASLGFERLKAGDRNGALAIFAPLLDTNAWARLGASMAYFDLDSIGLAKNVIQEGVKEENNENADTEFHTQHAALALASGDLNVARSHLDTALTLNPQSLRALTLLITIELIQNKKDKAQAIADSALAIHPNSVAANIAASEVAQAYFDLKKARKHIDKAIDLDPEEIHALVNRARIRFGGDDIRGAQKDIARAIKLNRNDAQVLSLLGFIELADGDDEQAERAFNNAIELDSKLGEPHFGMALLYFRQGFMEQGLFEMLIATMLEPKVSLYHSYLGKAYYQLRRFDEGFSALNTAKELDPRDPTPWLYESFFLRDMNRQVDALSSLKRAIQLNDNRAVYRSRFLLDQDLATKNVSLAEVYRQLGFEAWGASEALKSLEADITNSSAHLFLAQTYIGLPNRKEAGSSELLQYWLTSPVNNNSFHSFKEYTSLFDIPDNRISANLEIGASRHSLGNLGFKTGNNQFASNAFVLFERSDGVRIGKADEAFRAFFYSKFAVGRDTNLFFSIHGTHSNDGQETKVENYLLDLRESNNEVLVADVVFIKKMEPNPNVDNEFMYLKVSAGS